MKRPLIIAALLLAACVPTGTVERWRVTMPNGSTQVVTADGCRVFGDAIECYSGSTRIGTWRGAVSAVVVQEPRP